MGLRYQLCAIEKPLRLCGRGVGRVFAAGGGLGRGSEPEDRVAAGGAATGSKQPLSGTGLDTSFRSGFAVRFEGLCARAAQSRREDLDEPQGPAAGQRSCGKLFQDFETEEVECNEYESLAEAQAEIGAYIEREYNRRRLHSSLGYRPPEEYERLLEEAAEAA